MGSLLGRRSPGRQTERPSAAPDAPSKDTRYSAALRERSDPPHRDTPSRGWNAPAVPPTPAPSPRRHKEPRMQTVSIHLCPSCLPCFCRSLYGHVSPRGLWFSVPGHHSIPHTRQPRRCRQRPDTAGEALRGSSGCDVGKATPDSPSFPGCRVTAHRAIPKWKKMSQLTPLSSRDLPSLRLV